MKEYKAYKLSLIAVLAILSLPLYALLDLLSSINSLMLGQVANMGNIISIVLLIKSLLIVTHIAHIALKYMLIYLYALSKKFDFQNNKEKIIFAVFSVLGLLFSFFIVFGTKELVGLLALEILLMLIFVSFVIKSSIDKEKRML